MRPGSRPLPHGLLESLIIQRQKPAFQSLKTKTALHLRFWSLSFVLSRPGPASTPKPDFFPEKGHIILLPKTLLFLPSLDIMPFSDTFIVIRHKILPASLASVEILCPFQTLSSSLGIRSSPSTTHLLRIYALFRHFFSL